MKKPIKGGLCLVRYDAVLEGLFQRDHPALLEQLTRGVAVRESLNVEFASVVERRADLLFLLDDDSIFHLDFQSGNDSDMPYRVGIYGLMAGQKYRRGIVGSALHRAATGADVCTAGPRRNLGGLSARRYSRLRCGRVPHQRAGGLKPPDRGRVLGQLEMLSGLRHLSGKLTMELRRVWESQNTLTTIRSCGKPGYRAG